MVAARVMTGIKSTPHECNFYCEPALHAHPFWCADPLDDSIVAIIVGGRRENVIRWQVATELPPVDPSDPDEVAYPYRYVVWSVPGAAPKGH